MITYTPVPIFYGDLKRCFFYFFAAIHLKIYRYLIFSWPGLKDRIQIRNDLIQTKLFHIHKKNLDPPGFGSAMLL
jgi:hypothetical protein